MFERAIRPDLRRRLAADGDEAVIVSRVLRTWGASESALAEALGGPLRRPRGGAGPGAGGGVTIAFLASGIEGIKVRLTARAPDDAAAAAALDAEEARGARRHRRSPRATSCSALDDENMEQAVAALLLAQGLTVAVAESLTGGLVASRLVDVPGRQPLVPRRRGGLRLGGEVRRAGRARRAGGHRGGGRRHGRPAPRRVLGADVGLGITGVAGPDDQEGVAAGHGLRGPGPARRAGGHPRLPAARATGPGSASTPPSPPSTCCGAPCWPGPAPERSSASGSVPSSAARRSSVCSVTFRSPRSRPPM